MIISESDMQFGDYQESYVFRIEKSDVYNKIKSDGVKIVEFVLLKKDKLLLLEAKKSAPNPNSHETPERFGDYINEISDKMCNSLDLYLYQLSLKKLQDSFLEIDYQKTSIVFILVIKNQRKEWLVPVQEALSKKLNSYKRISKIWRCKVIVINEEQAIAKKLVYNKQETNN